MADVFVKTVKRDYASCNRLSDAGSVIGQLKGWIEDYNEYAPHKDIKWLSPRQYRREALERGKFPGEYNQFLKSFIRLNRGYSPL